MIEQLKSKAMASQEDEHVLARWGERANSKILASISLLVPPLLMLLHELPSWILFIEGLLALTRSATKILPETWEGLTGFNSCSRLMMLSLSSLLRIVVRFAKTETMPAHCMVGHAEALGGHWNFVAWPWCFQCVSLQLELKPKRAMRMNNLLQWTDLLSLDT